MPLSFHLTDTGVTGFPGRVSSPCAVDQTCGFASVASLNPLGAGNGTVCEPAIHPVFEHESGTWQYIVADLSTLKAVIIDPVLDFHPGSMTIATKSADALLALVQRNGFTVEMILETHVHADHITAASYLQNVLASQQDRAPQIGIGRRITQVQQHFGKRYGIHADEYEAAFDRLLDDDEVFAIGDISCQVLHLPGHTPDHIGYKIGDNLFTGDSIFNIDVGSARTDFPGGCARSLFASKAKMLALPAHTKLWVGHDYPHGERVEPVPCATVAQHRKENKHLKDGTMEDEFIQARQDRDLTLSEPRLLHYALQMNIRAGRLPDASRLGDRFMHLPLKCSAMTK